MAEPHPHSQSRYQVRFDWAAAGARAIAGGADVVLWVDALGDPVPPELPAPVVLVSFRDRGAVAAWVLAQQGDKGDRFTVAVVAAGVDRADGGVRFALEDQLAAGAVIDALADLGIDYCSPEAAAAAASFTGLRSATAHLVSSSASGQEFDLAGRRRELDRALELDASTDVRVVREFSLES